MISARTPLIVSLDTDLEQAKHFVKLFGDNVDTYKIHWLYEQDTSILSYLKEAGKKIMLDMKIHDIDETNMQRIQAFSAQGVDKITFHLFPQTQSALLHIGEVRFIEPIGVTVLSSINDEDIQKQVGVSISVTELSKRLVQLGYECGIRSFVASGHDIDVYKKLYPDIKLYIPGISFDEKHTQYGEQKRAVYYKKAFKMGADYIISGRGVLEHENPAKLVDEVLEFAESL
jgi:orotidine-5'-phosphate decarboxylase